MSDRQELLPVVTRIIGLTVVIIAVSYVIGNWIT